MNTNNHGGTERLYEFIEKLLDREARIVFQYLYESGKEVTEAEIMEKTALRPNDIRRALNELAEKGLVTYRKIRLPDRMGRNSSIFYWRTHANGIKALVMHRKKAVIEKLRILLEHENSNYYYICPLDKTRYNMDEAMEYNFTCPRCGSLLEPDEEREYRVEYLAKLIERLERSLAESNSS